MLGNLRKTRERLADKLICTMNFVRKRLILVPASVFFLSIGLAVTGCSSASKSHNTSSSPPAGASTTSGTSLVGTFKVQRFGLENGLRILIVEDHSSPTFAYHTWFRVGSRDEEPGRTGLAHLFEHLMFKGTETLPEGQFDKILESAGAEGENAFTSRDYTAYIQEMPKDKLDLIAKLESDRMVHLVVNDQSFKTEREVVQNERRYRVENSPEGQMYQELFGIAFTQHPYHWPVIGYQEDLDRMTSEDAKKFYKSYYSPNHATLVIVGDVNPTEVMTVLRKYYGPIASAESPTHVILPEPPQTAPRRKILKLNVQVEKIIIGFHIPPETAGDAPAIVALQTILAQGKSSRLHRALVETGIATGVEAYDLDDKDPSLFLVGVNLQKKRKSAEAESVVLREIAQVIKTPISAAELERARNQMSFTFYESLSSDSEKANFLGRFEAISPNGFETGLNIHRKALEVTPAQIQAVAKKYLDPKTRSIVVGVPK